MNRYYAFLVHLGISLLVFGVLVAILLLWWYPGIFFETDGGWQGIRIIAVVDLVLGPLLTLVVYKKGKPSLAFDLTAIGVFQALCLAGGTWVVYNERPLAMIMVDDVFYSMSAGDFREAGVEVPDFSQFEGRGPKWLTVDLPQDVYELADLRKQTMSGGPPLWSLHQRYVPFKVEHLSMDRSITIDELQERDSETKAIPGWLEKHGGSLENYAFFPLGTRYRFVHLGVSRDRKEIVGVLDTPVPY